MKELEEWTSQSNITEKESEKLKKVIENQPLKGEMKDGLPPITGDTEKILKHIVAEAESEITESKALENKNNIENTFQKADRLKKELDELYKIEKESKTEDLDKKILAKKAELIKLIESN